MVSVCTYNILSTKLVSPAWHVGVPGYYLATQHRWDLIKKELDNKIKQDYIICIQELSEEWLSKLLVHFNKYGYTFIYDSGWLGTGIAFPKKYTLEDINLLCVGDELKKSAKPIVRANNIFTRIYEWFLSFSKKDNWQLAINKKNKYVKVTLSKEKGKPFDVYTYHMPCAFTNPDLMLIQACGLLSFINREAGKNPYILAGDFNTKPNDEVYNMILKGIVRPVYSKKFSSLPVFNITPLKSANYEINRREPNFTCSAWSKTENKLFRETIDYIFYSEGFKVESVEDIGHRERGPFPCSTEGSDHIMISAVLKLAS